MSNAQTTKLVAKLKENDEDFEFYPTTKEIIACIHNYLNSDWHFNQKIDSVLDIGCGTENFRKYMEELYHQREQWKEQHSKKANGETDYSICNATNFRVRRYYVMEKSPILLQQLDKETIVLGTDFNENTLDYQNF